ncbi:hypothetical protein B5807_04295 [Epicoccum nigrum]|jgi:hypothetical protein|uniref:Uncharacterized protein n=1 Tax=Epicoccum nigrum TaxID=105696 RepID=A0A1Y2M4B5_EPING|nr:hypothetical protein B5807_04295 [Epicoccum nigrum]
MQPSILIDLQQFMLDEGGDLLSSYLSDMPPVVPKHDVLSITDRSHAQRFYSATNRVAATAQSPPDDDGHSVNSTTKGKYDIGSTLSISKCWLMLIFDWLSNLRVYHKGCPCALSTNKRQYGAIIRVPTRSMVFSIVERHTLLPVWNII